MSLESGTYQIKSTLTNDTIGRDSIEHRSYFPKDIVVQTRPGFEFANTHWEVERQYKTYYLKIGGAATGLLDRDSSGKIVAIVRERFGGYSREWTLRPAAETGSEEGDIYHIFNSDEGSNLVWTIADDKNAPNRDRQILVLAEFDPSSSKQAFTFVKVVN